MTHKFSLKTILKQKKTNFNKNIGFFSLLKNQEQNITYQQLSQNSKNIAIKLQSLIPQGSRALLLYPQGLEFINAFLGCLYAGIIAVPAYPPKRNQKMSRLAAIIKDAEPQIILTVCNFSL